MSRTRNVSPLTMDSVIIVASVVVGENCAPSHHVWKNKDKKEKEKEKGKKGVAVPRSPEE